jgi:two-component system, NarL family, nitrate/nitrite response regulator NarL
MIEINGNVVTQVRAGLDGASAGASAPVLAILLGENALLFTGLKHLLSGTRFVVTEMAWGDSLPQIPHGRPVLFIVSASHWTDETISTIRHLKTQCPIGRVCMLADDFDITRVMEAYDAGVDGFCLMTADRDVLTRSLDLIALGEDILPSGIVLSVLAQLSRQAGGQSRHTSNDKTRVSIPIAHKLSVREGEILRGLMEGEPNKVIARRFGLSEATVKVHVKAILRKIGAKNRTQAAMWASDHIVTENGDSAGPVNANYKIDGEHRSFAR